MRRFILSIDGGGIRGIIPAVFLSELKKTLEKNGVTEPFHQIFDLIAGTSTGGLISLALTVPIYQKDGGELYDKAGGIAAEQLPVLYKMLANKVFPGNKNRVRKTIRQVFTSKYSSIPFHNVLRGLFKNCTVKEALTNLLLTTFNMETMQPVFIKKRPLAAGGDTDPNFYMADAALSTAAVPTYFPPGYVNSIGDITNSYCLIDGGIFCINPAMSALTEARKIFPRSEYIILSLGTGQQKEEYKTEKIRNWGFFNWIAPWLGLPLITAIGEGQRISTNHMLNKLPQVKLIRSDIYLDKNAGIDDGGAENLEYLTAKGIEMWNANKSEIDTLIKNIVNNQQLRGDNKVRKIV
ncbi:MAG: patatin [Clostridiaceae bacterium]|jgi:patatin-like phospholipase/acyl hydrolase|nr:patatin [Clostridiaceae bacterium]